MPPAPDGSMVATMPPWIQGVYAAALIFISAWMVWRIMKR